MAVRNHGLVPDEPADASDLEDALHWIAVYEDLMRTLDRITAPEAAVPRELALDRLNWWRRRTSQLRGE
jgi:hypothetical protein